MKLNIGCGTYALPGWINIDCDPQSKADWIMDVPPLPFSDGGVCEVYAGHFLEHLDQHRADDFLNECYRVLEHGGKVGIMVPDTREVMRRYIQDEPAPMEFPQGVHRDLRDLDDVCDVILFSTAQLSRHHWAYDTRTLARTLQHAGFRHIREFDRYADPRVAVGAWYQFGLEANKP